MAATSARMRVARAPALRRIVVAVDPAISNNESSDETGIIVCGVDEVGDGYVLEDRSGRFSPSEWAQIAVGLYHKYHADRIIAEKTKAAKWCEAPCKAPIQTCPSN
jgi:phage terminase large subunit-like protein